MIPVAQTAKIMATEILMAKRDPKTRPNSPIITEAAGKDQSPLRCFEQQVFAAIGLRTIASTKALSEGKNAGGEEGRWVRQSKTPRPMITAGVTGSSDYSVNYGAGAGAAGSAGAGSAGAGAGSAGAGAAAGASTGAGAGAEF